MQNRLLLTDKCFIVIDRVYAGLVRALRDIDGALRVDLGLLKGELAARTLQDTQSLSHASKPAAAASAAYEAFVTAYFEFTVKSRRMLGPAVRPLEAEDIDPKRAVALFGEMLPYRVGKEGSVEQAMHVAVRNEQCSRDALNALFFLSELAAPHRAMSERPGFDTAVSAARKFLFDDVRSYQFTRTKLALIQGDLATLDAIRNELFEQSFSEGMMVMHLFSDYGRLPGWSAGATEDAFRTGLKTALAVPLGAVETA